jgi:CcmD family protein
MSDWPWVIASYGLTWLVLGAYALGIRRRLQRAQEEFERESSHVGSSMEAGS